jgi:hypothetical protein
VEDETRRSAQPGHVLWSQNMGPWHEWRQSRVHSAIRYANIGSKSYHWEVSSPEKEHFRLSSWRDLPWFRVERYMRLHRAAILSYYLPSSTSCFRRSRVLYTAKRRMQVRGIVVQPTSKWKARRNSRLKEHASSCYAIKPIIVLRGLAGNCAKRCGSKNHSGR